MSAEDLLKVIKEIHLKSQDNSKPYAERIGAIQAMANGAIIRDEIESAEREGGKEE
jgi:hypothetical protein